MSALRTGLAAPEKLFTLALKGVALLVLLISVGLFAAAKRLFGSGDTARPGALVLIQDIARNQHTWSARMLGKQAEDVHRPLPWAGAFGVLAPLCLLVVLTVVVMPVLFAAASDGGVTLTETVVLVVLLAFGWLLAHRFVRLLALLTDWLLSPSQLARRVAELAESRAETVDARASELRRIERDLHDGAQARLVALRMSLGMAQDCSDPVQLQEFLAEAYESAGQALDDLRTLVRGIHPPVLAERGLAGGIEAAALRCPVPVRVYVELAGRPEAPVESALYFATTELLVNIAKHSGANGAVIRLTGGADGIRVVVTDDGRGGAELTAGAGLHGIERRLAAFDGKLTISSPKGGPSEFTMEVPCALS
ncbi:sensor histidine kinase [Saccharopolyspora sp. 5N102]|uniref:sensor histidine kinase n=1 Tax=Saccharopolyspora sp. 5N102 TaxID=3375155 RepID=UPI0037AA7AAA